MALSLLYSQFSYPYITPGKILALTRQTFVGKVMSLLFNVLSRIVIAFFFKEQMSFNFMAAVTICSDFGAQGNKGSVYIVFSPISHEVMGPDAKILVFWILSFKSAFSFFSPTSIKRLFRSSSLSARRVVSTAYLKLFIFLLAILIPASPMYTYILFSGYSS